MTDPIPRHITLDAQTLAEERTDWAEDRTLMANERTFAGWLRTGLACIGMALGLKAVFLGSAHPWLAHSVASLFILLAIGIFWIARDNACDALQRLHPHRSHTQSRRAMTLLSLVLSLCAGAVGVVLWTL